MDSPFGVVIQFGYPVWFWLRFLPNHGCKTQTALFNKKMDISGFEGLEIMKVCMEYLHKTGVLDSWFYNGIEVIEKMVAHREMRLDLAHHFSKLWW